MAADAGIKSSQVSPKFLHSNSTSHTWPFSAVAELIDNAYDPDVSASEIWIDKRKIGRFECLTFVDNGNGMVQEKLYKMLSFGYCEKVTVGNVKPIGHYGNGFKSGSMRLGKDAMVFTRTLTSTSIGFLSQTYLQGIKADAVVVPIVTWSIQDGIMLGNAGRQFDMNLKAILQYSPFKTEKDLLMELNSLEKMKTGTSIIVFNLKCDSTNASNFELDFASDPLDIRNPETPVIDLTSINRPIYSMSPEYRRSLREYCSILYLKPRMKIVLRGVKVKSKLISKSLSQTEVDVYKPTWLDKPIKLTFGFSDRKEPDSYGLMMYHKNRLILAYEKIGCQKQANDHGVSVIGVVEADFLEPIHNKQEFNKTAHYVTFMHNAAVKLNDYYYEKTRNENPGGANATSQTTLPDWTWAQCDNCLSWRRLPTGYNEKLPDKWYCYLNPDAAFNRCDIPEEPEDDDEALQPTYRKTYKKTMAEKNRHAKMEEARKLREKEEALKRKEQMLQFKMREITRKEEVLGEVSSSQDKVDRKPTIADLERAKKSIQVYQEKMIKQEQTIQQLENQKKQIEENSKAMINMAETLRLSSVTSKQLADKVHAGTSSTTVSSSSTSLRAPTKRKSDADEDSKLNVKVTKIKTEDGGYVQVFTDDKVVDLTLEEEEMEAISSSETDGNLPDEASAIGDLENDPGVSENNQTMEHKDNSNDSDKGKSVNTTPSKSGKGKGKGKTSASCKTSGKRKDADENVTDKDVAEKGIADKDIDKETCSGKEGEISDEMTEAQGNDKAEETMDTDTAAGNYTELTEDDVKPDKDELDKDLAGCSKDIGNKAGGSEDIEEKVLIPKGVQTVPTVIKFASPEEVDLLKLTPLEQTQMMLQKSRELDETKKDLDETKTSLKSLQESIWQLLKIIVEDFDYGDPENIEKVILDFIRVNGEQNDQPSTSS